MKKLRIFFIFSLISVSIIFSVYNYINYFRDPCDNTIKYRIGRFDKEFGITEDYFKKQIENATLVWENETKKDLFVYDPNGDLEINLIYDTRQRNTLIKQRSEYGLGKLEESLQKLDSKFSSMKKEYDFLLSSYESRESTFNKAKEKYESDVNFWNKRDGAPEKQYLELQRQAEFLKKEAQILNTEADKLNQKADQLKVLLEDRNRVASEYNKAVKSYNEKYGHGIEFSQGEYDGRSINLYQFLGEKDLQMVLMHELGHSLGMEHVDDQNSIMYYLIEGNKNYKLTPSNADLLELARVCDIKT